MECMRTLEVCLKSNSGGQQIRISPFTIKIASYAVKKSKELNISDKDSQFFPSARSARQKGRWQQPAIKVLRRKRPKS